MTLLIVHNCAIAFNSYVFRVEEWKDTLLNLDYMHLQLKKTTLIIQTIDRKMSDP